MNAWRRRAVAAILCRHKSAVAQVLARRHRQANVANTRARLRVAKPTPQVRVIVRLACNALAANVGASGRWAKLVVRTANARVLVFVWMVFVVALSAMANAKRVVRRFLVATTASVCRCLQARATKPIARFNRL